MLVDAHVSDQSVPVQVEEEEKEVEEEEEGKEVAQRVSAATITQ